MNVAGPDRVMAIRWPRREDQDDSSTALAGDPVALVGREGEQRAHSCLDDVAARLDTRRSVDDHQPSPFSYLVLAEFLTRRKTDDDRPCPVNSLESLGSAGPLGHLDLSHVPRLHCADSRSWIVELAC